ncbi:hypothetical protein HOY82DRAFT_569504 [Tuber indicum]|nr:hypothetical protein HOY82DRAFT_569504 [Tuber indicum]
MAIHSSTRRAAAFLSLRNSSRVPKHVPCDAQTPHTRWKHFISAHLLGNWLGKAPPTERIRILSLGPSIREADVLASHHISPLFPHGVEREDDMGRIVRISPHFVNSLRVLVPPRGSFNAPSMAKQSRGGKEKESDKNAPQPSKDLPIYLLHIAILYGVVRFPGPASHVWTKLAFLLTIIRLEKRPSARHKHGAGACGYS